MTGTEAGSESVRPPKPYQPTPILGWLYRRWFSHITVDERWSDSVRSAAARGVVVYVMRSLSFLDFLCLDFLIKRFTLPLVRFVNDTGLWILEPMGRGDRKLRLRRKIPEEKALSTTIKETCSALLFLRRPPRLGRAARGENLEVDLIRTLIETQRKVDKPILLLPQTFVWSKLPPNKKRSLLDLFFGPAEWPGRIRVFFQFLLNYRNALLRSGQPFDLKKFIARHQELTDGQLADKVRYAMLRIMERERELVLGPDKKTPSRIRDELLRSPRVRKHIAAEARKTKRPVPKVVRAARKDLRRVCAAQDPYVLGLLHRVLDRVWNRIYAGIEVDEEGIERLRSKAREGTLVLLPSHKSHIDYIVLSDVLYRYALSPPLIAAGDNLSFWPLGPILRRGGAFFIRRSFKGRKLYAALVDAYLRKLLVEGFNIEFFLEGGRSRTGKLLPPKFGLLTMVIDAALMLPRRKVFFVPISIGYERIIEERSYVDEQAGAEKQKENIGELLKTPRVLRSRYGRLYVQFGEIVSFDEALDEVVAERTGDKTDKPRTELAPQERRSLVRRIGHRVVYRINEVTVVTPSALVATVLLAHTRRGITRAELLASATRVTSSLCRRGARVAHTLLDEDGELRQDTLDEATRLFVDGKLLSRHGDDDEAIFNVPEERRMAVEYYKNNVLHFFVPSALISTALLTDGGDPVSEHVLRQRVLQLSRLFKYEFGYRADANFDDIFDDALHSMLEAEELVRIADRIRAADGEQGALVIVYASMLRTYFESYRLAVRAARLLIDGPMTRKEWLKKALALGQRMYLAGELELRESLSKLRLDNAITALRDHEVLAYGELGTLEIGTEHADSVALEELESKLAAVG